MIFPLLLDGCLQHKVPMGDEVRRRKRLRNSGEDSKDNKALWHFKNRNLTSEIPYISTRRPQTPDKRIGTLCAKCATQEVLKKGTNCTLYWLNF